MSLPVNAAHCVRVLSLHIDIAGEIACTRSPSNAASAAAEEKTHVLSDLKLLHLCQPDKWMALLSLKEFL